MRYACTQRVLLGIFIVLMLPTTHGETYTPSTDAIGSYRLDYAWTVVGCSPLTVALIGSLLDLGIAKDSILWVADTFAYAAPQSLQTNNRDIMFFLKQYKAFSDIYTHLEQYKNNPAASITPHELMVFAIGQLRKIIATTTMHIHAVNFNKQKKLYSFDWYGNTINTHNIIFDSVDIPTPDFLTRNINRNKSSNSEDIIAINGSFAECDEAVKQLVTIPHKKLVALYTDAPESNYTPPANCIFLPKTLDNVFAQLPHCTKIINCPSMEEAQLPQFNNVAFVNAPHNAVYAPGLFVINHHQWIHTMGCSNYRDLAKKVFSFVQGLL